MFLKHQRPTILAILALILVAIAACGDSDTTGGGGAGGTGNGSGNGSGAGAVCYDIPVNDSTDGSAACGPEVCGAGDYCFSTVGICRPGCIGELDCARGQACDLSNATPNEDEALVGLCVVPGPEHEVACGGAGGGGQTPTCASRCANKAALCMAPDASLCDQLCAQSPSSNQLDCIEQTSCMDLAEAFEMGMPLCGIGG